MSETKKTKIMLIEDNPEFREVLEFALADEENIEVMARFGSAEFALNEIRDLRGKNLPDLILLDLQLTGMSGLEAIPYLQKSIPHVKIIILSQSDRSEDVLRAISLGTSGYLLKSSTISDVIEGIEVVMEGGASLDPKVAGLLLKTVKNCLPKKEMQDFLTKREMEVLELLANGFLKKEISDKLNISYPTVDNHIRNIYSKLDVNNGPSAVNAAHKLGLL